jgi:hypothetical protein
VAPTPAPDSPPVAAPAADVPAAGTTPGRSLLVLDDATGAPLPSARAYAASDDQAAWSFDEGHQVPDAATLARAPRTGDEHGLVELGTVPRERTVEERHLVDPAAALGARAWYVVAPGHEWYAVTVDARQDAPQEVRLRRAGSLTVTIRRWTELAEPRAEISSADDLDAAAEDKSDEPPDLSLSDDDWDEAILTPDANGVARVEGLLPGPHEVVVRRGSSGLGYVYGRGRVDIAAGSEAWLTIEPKLDRPPEKVTVTGDLLVPEGWGAWPTTIGLHGAEESNAEFDRSVHARPPPGLVGRTIHFEIGGVPEGRCRLVAEPFAWVADVVVGPGATHLELDMGAPATVTVRVVDDVSGRPIDDAKVLWNRTDVGDILLRFGVLERPVAGGTTVLRVPAGRVDVSAEAPRHAGACEAVDVTAGAQVDVTLRLKRSGILVVKLECDGQPFVARHPELTVTPERDSWFAGLQWSSSSNSVHEFPDVVPGRYEVSVDASEIRGWTCAPEHADVRAGETTTVVLRFTKR